MTLKFRKVQRKVLGGDDKDKVKTYAMARSSNYCDMDKLCELISSRSAMSSADVKAILDSLNWAMSLELRSVVLYRWVSSVVFVFRFVRKERRRRMLSMLP